VADRPQAAEHTELTSRERERARKFAHLGDARNPTTEHSELRWAEKKGTQHFVGARADTCNDDVPISALALVELRPRARLSTL
jgi:hypothetical protein